MVEAAVEARRVDVGVGAMVAIWKRSEVVIVATVEETDERTLLMVVVALDNSETSRRAGAGRSIRQGLGLHQSDSRQTIGESLLGCDRHDAVLSLCKEIQGRLLIRCCLQVSQGTWETQRDAVTAV